MGEWLDREALAQHIGVRVDRIRRLQRAAKLPQPSYHLGQREPRWARAEVDAMFAGHAAPAKPSTDQAVASLVQRIASRRR